MWNSHIETDDQIITINTRFEREKGKAPLQCSSVHLGPGGGEKKVEVGKT